MLLTYHTAIQNLANVFDPEVPLRDVRHTQPFNALSTHVMSYSSEVDNGSKEAAKEKKEGERRGVYHFAQCWAMTGHSKGVSLLYYY